MTLSILDRGEGRFDLLRGNDAIGSIDGRTVGFRGFENRSSARRAATVAYDALSAWLARERRAVPAPRGGRSLTIRRHHGEEHLMLGEIDVGRVLPPYEAAEDGSSSGGEHGFELLLPPRLGAALSAAQVIYNSLERHRALRALERPVAAV